MSHVTRPLAKGRGTLPAAATLQPPG